MAQNLPQSVPWHAIDDFFCCPVCMNYLSEAYMTKCGHRYCMTCIKECIDRHHKCPCCNNCLSQCDIFRDHQFDELCRICVTEKEKSEKEYLDGLLNKAFINKDRGPLNEVLSPVECVLKEHLKKTFSSYEKYHQDVKNEFAEKIAHLEKEFEINKKKLMKQSQDNKDITQKLERLENGHKTQLEILEKDLQRIGQLLGESFNKYLEEHIPEMSVLPVTVNLSILNKSIQLPGVVVKPHDSIEDIKDLFRHEMQAKGDKIVEFGEDVQFLYFRPLARRSLYEMHRIAEDIINKDVTHNGVTVLPSNCMPILEYQLQPGSEIAILGQVICDSDLSKRCFTVNYQADILTTVDYFTCKDCQINWICRACMEVCHKDHNIVPYIMNHRPTWPCCYCAKKKRCINQ